MDAAWILLVIAVAGATSQPANRGGDATSKPIEHTVHFAGQGSWPSQPTSAPPAVSFDRYGQPITQATQDLTNRTQAAVSQTGTALKEGFDAGVRAANQQLSVSNPFATSASAPAAPASALGVSSPWGNGTSAGATAPAWQSNATAPSFSAASAPAATSPTPGWTSIGSSVPAPPLLVPRSPMATPTYYGSTSVTSGRNGPNFPMVASNDPPLHSLLTDPANPSPTARSAVVNRADDLAAGWGDTAGAQQPSISRSGNQTTPVSRPRESDLVPLSSGQTSQDRYSNPGAGSFASNDGWPQQSAPSLSTQPTIESASTNRQLPAPPATNGLANPAVSSPFASQPPGQQPFAQQAPAQQPAGMQMPPMGNYAASGMNGGMNSMNGGSNLNPQKSAAASDQPWMPLVLAVLTLAGSLAANLFLGMSYLDARQKYQSLVRKTADTFRRVKAAAA